ncbi:auxin response factor 2 isoform X4 [Arachis ipaensis]|uniref:auxin response factor 2 isoform X4 n=1 Tax=Arachis ipaensis TaxID=130454 RepID=UPI000A2B582E|nr:auxin response factor 2 isoform X4 [Arachis ipaensis]
MFILHLLPPPHPKEEASTNQVADQHMPVYDLPSKILCRVINVQLKAEPDTDEQDENAVDKEPPLPPRCRLLPCTLCLHLDKWSLSVSSTPSLNFAQNLTTTKLPCHDNNHIMKTTSIRTATAT